MSDPKSDVNQITEKLLAQLKGSERDGFVEDLKPQLIQLKKYNYGKQIAAIEKLIFTGPAPSYIPASIAPTPQTLPIEINSTAATPMLTNGQNSPQSSSLPSTNVSTIEDSADVANKAIELDAKLKLDGKTCPDVVINGL